MRDVFRHALRFAATCMLLVVPAVQAGVTLKVEGVDEALRNAVRAAVSLSQYRQRDVSAAQMRLLQGKAGDEVRKALQPYGYYKAQVTTRTQRKDKDWVVILDVQPGPAVIVRSIDIRMARAARTLPAVAEAIRRFHPAIGQRLDDGLYAASKQAIQDALTANGYLDARTRVHRVDVRLADDSAAVHLAWDVGSRYRFGAVHFKGSPFHPGFLQRYMSFHPGDFYDQSKLLRLQQTLSGTDYFRVVDVQPQVAHPHDGRVDVDVQLKPNPRSVYTGGPFIGTDTGFGVRGGIDRRWVNNRGDTWKNQLVLAQRLKTLSTLYEIPQPGPHQRSLEFGATYRRAITSSSLSHSLELAAGQNRLWHGWLTSLGLHLLSGTFTVGASGGLTSTTPGLERGQSTLLYPELSLVKKHADTPDFVRHGWLLSLVLRASPGTVLSDTRFTQALVHAKWIHGFGLRNRLIVRGSAGTTVAGDFNRLPPQLRFFAGGDRSVRGYGYQAIGPRNSYGLVIGGRNLLVGSVTAEHYFTRDWGVATFVDAGNAFNGHDYSPRIGTGLGLRWRSPVGLIRLDLGFPVHDRNAHGVHLHLVIGPDL